MSEQPENPLERPRQVAMYRETRMGWYTIFEYQGEADHLFHSGYVRISAPAEVRLSALESEEAIRTAIASLDSAEKQLVAQFQENLRQIKEQKNNLLALTHQPDTSGAS